MFLPLNFQSINRDHCLTTENILARCHEYVNRGTRCVYQLYEYRDCQSNEVLAYDLVAAITGEIGVYLHDYMKLENGLWRSAYGETSFNFDDLIPPEMRHARLVSSVDISLSSEK